MNEQTIEDKVYGSDLEDRLLGLKHSQENRSDALDEGYCSQKDYEESTK